MRGNLIQIAICVLLAGMGTLAKTLNQANKESVQFARTLSACFVAMFTGLLVYYFAAYFNIDSNLSYAIAGLSGWTGPQVLDILTTIASRNIGVDLKSDNNNKT